MTVRLDGLVIRGEIDNTHPYSVCGWLRLRGHPAPLMLNLTGNCDSLLKGRRVRFEDPVPLDDRDESAEDISDLAWQQIGPTGRMELDLSNEEPGRLRLEWFSQNGRVTLELRNPILEPLEEDSEEDADPHFLPWLDITPPELFGGTDLDEALFSEDALFSDDDDDEDPYGLFTPGLFDALDNDSEELDFELFGEMGYEPPPGSPEAEMIEGFSAGEAIFIHEIFDPPIRLSRPDLLNDREVEAPLKFLLARLAEHGISLEVCEHFTPREAYELLLDEICPFQMTHVDLNVRQWVQHFSTSDYCEECEAEFEREVEEFERNRRRDDDDDD